jgi:hypothetical protein
MSFFEQAFFDKDTDWDKKLSWLEVWESTDQTDTSIEEDIDSVVPPDEPDFSANDSDEDEWEDMDEQGEEFMDNKLN